MVMIELLSSGAVTMGEPYEAEGRGSSVVIKRHPCVSPS